MFSLLILVMIWTLLTGQIQVLLAYMCLMVFCSYLMKKNKKRKKNIHYHKI